MKLAIMQPYFFPYLGYFDLIYNVDLFLVFDTVQFTKRGWIARNRILHPGKSAWQYILAPIDQASFHRSDQTPILDVQIATDMDWKGHLLGQLAHYRNKAPRAHETIDFVHGCLGSDEASISRLDVELLHRCALLMNMDFNYRYCSALDIELEAAAGPEGRILDLCEFLGATDYVNLPGGVHLYDEQHFKHRNIKLTFRHLPTFQYDTGAYEFVPNLSIVDALMWNEPAAIKGYLDAHREAG